ncbi:MAG: hypothetical protein ACWGQW_05940, partial [bacterium]
MAAKKEKSENVEVVRVEEKELHFCVLGRDPGLLNNAMSEKTKQELLFPRGRKTAADKASTLKHNPLKEYRDSCYKSIHEDSSTRIQIRATSFKAAMASVALDIPGAAKAQIERLVYVRGDYINVYGIPQIHMAVVRNKDMNRTPDVRTRACIPEWACYLTISFTSPILKEKDVVQLLANAGFMRGVGDWRPEKGSGSYGQFELVSENNPDFQRIIKAGGREAQDAALLSPQPYDG